MVHLRIQDHAWLRHGRSRTCSGARSWGRGSRCHVTQTLFHMDIYYLLLICFSSHARSDAKPRMSPLIPLGPFWPKLLPAVMFCIWIQAVVGIVKVNQGHLYPVICSVLFVACRSCFSWHSTPWKRTLCIFLQTDLQKENTLFSPSTPPPFQIWFYTLVFLQVKESKAVVTNINVTLAIRICCGEKLLVFPRRHQQLSYLLSIICLLHYPLWILPHQ